MIAARPVALVTGAARRVGRAIAVELAEAGFDLIITANRRADEASKTIDLCREAAGDATFSGQVEICDLNVPQAVDQLATTLGSLSRLDAIVHNASSYGPTPVDSISLDDLLAHYRINAASPALLTARLAPRLRESTLSGGAAVVCFSDIHVLGRPRRNHLAYSMSKAALSAMIETLALDLAPHVRINGIAPGVIAWPDDADPDEVRAYESRIPLDRPGTPQDAARIVRWLILDATYITGEIIRLDGGRWLR